MIEQGLVFVDKEYRLPSVAGANGRIDIVARDRFGHVVVIEIKRSDQAARQALHEVHKYTALFRISQGLDESRLRLIVVSTDWHELQLPLSEFAGTTQYSVEGILITATAVGSVTHVSKIDLSVSTGPVKVSRVQYIYLYANATRRDDCLNQLVAAINESGIKDFAVFRCDYSGNDPRVIYPYGHYLCFSSPAHTLAAAEFERCKARIDWEEDLEQPDENFVANINKTMVNFCDDSELGYPEKLTNIRASGWTVHVSLRLGRMGQEDAVLTDKEIIALAQALDGNSPIYLHKVTSPRFTAGWKQLCGDLPSVLLGNSTWSDVVPRFLAEIESSAPTATVSISLYNPANLLMTLYWIAWNQDYSLCPHLEIVVEDKAAHRVRILMGILVWDSHTIFATPEELMNQVYGGGLEWVMAVTMHQTYEQEDSALAAHHLRAATVEWRFNANGEIGPKELLVKEENLLRQPFEETNQRPFREFIVAHKDYLAALKAFLETKAAGLPGSPV
jgi:hypothetical protein